MVAREGSYICRKCGKEKPLSQFYVSRKTTLGHQSRCKDCDNGARSDRLAVEAAADIGGRSVAHLSCPDPPELPAEQRFGAQDPERGITERWWRLTVDESGHVTSCEPVEAVGTNGLGVLYVLAFDRKGAQKAAFNEYCKLRNRIRRARYDQEGKCACGRLRDIDGGRKCSICLDQSQQAKDRQAQRARGENVEPLDRTDAYRRRREEEQAQQRRAVLTEVRQRWLTSSPAAFDVWLAGELGETTQRRARGC